MAAGHGHATSEPAGPGAKVLSVSAHNPQVRTVLVHRPAPADASFIPATLKGLAVTLKHFFRNVTARKDTETIPYPEEKAPYPERFRGLHRLMHRDDGAVRCVACMCCPTVCPAHCITIIPGETRSPDGNEVIEKYPAVFEIDELRCVVCGLCVEACPCDAIRMDTAVHAPPVEERGHAVLGKADLLSRGAASSARQGGEGSDWRGK